MNCLKLAMTAALLVLSARSATPVGAVEAAPESLSPRPGPAGNLLEGRAAHATDPVTSAKAWLLHLPGIAGEAGVDHDLIRGLRDGGYSGEIEVYDWVGNNPGIPALRAREHNEKESRKIADLIVARHTAHPDERVVLTGHSAGTGLAVWALEKLPPDVKVDTVLMLASALSPGYDLTAALTHVRGNAYAFNNPGDSLVLGTGTTVFGTVDGRKCEAAGKCGFSRPASADPEQYAKLVAKPYDRAWVRYDNLGDHIGVMATPFAETVLAPLVLGRPDVSAVAPTTRPLVAPANSPTAGARAKGSKADAGRVAPAGS